MVQNRNRPDLTWTGTITVMLSTSHSISSSVKSQESVATDRDRVPIEMAPRTNEIRVNTLAPQYIVLVNVHRKQTSIIYKYLVFRLNSAEFSLALFYSLYDKHRPIVLSLQRQQLVVELSHSFYAYRKVESLSISGNRSNNLRYKHSNGTVQSSYRLIQEFLWK